MEKSNCNSCVYCFKLKLPLYRQPSGATIIGMCECKKNTKKYRSFVYIKNFQRDTCKTYSEGIKKIGVLPGTDIPAGINEKGEFVRVDPLVNDKVIYDAIYVRGLVKKIKEYIKFLDKEDYPRDGICSHFGVGFKYDFDWVGIGEYGEDESGEGKLLITIYLPEFHLYLGRQREFYTKLKGELSISLWSDCIEEWNGLEGQKGISVVFNRAAPESISCSVKNYRNLKDVFNCTDEENGCWNKFRVWLEGKKVK